MLYIGSHVSFNKDTQLLGSVNESISYGSNTFMFYTGAPQNTLRMPINNDLTKVIIDEKEYDVGGTVVGENDKIDIKDLWPTDKSTMPYFQFLLIII